MLQVGFLFSRPLGAPSARSCSATTVSAKKKKKKKNGEYVLAGGATLSGTASRGGILTLQPGVTVTLTAPTRWPAAR